MDEASVKAKVLEFVREAGGDRISTVTSEFSLGRSGVRADLALWADGELIGVEIKTERDSLRRLPSQLRAYSRYFDHVVLVVAPRHQKGIAKINLHGASTWTCDDEGVRSLAFGERNPIEPASHLDLLTAEERRRLLASGRSTRSHFSDVFRKRYGATSERFWKAVDQREIRSDDVSLLSRFVDQRAAYKALQSEREARWQRWNQAYTLQRVGCPA